MIRSATRPFCCDVWIHALSQDRQASPDSLPPPARTALAARPRTPWPPRRTASLRLACTDPRRHLGHQVRRATTTSGRPPTTTVTSPGILHTLDEFHRRWPAEPPRRSSSVHGRPPPDDPAGQLDHVGQAGLQATRTLEEHDGARFGRQRTQALPACPSRRGRKPSKTKRSEGGPLSTSAVVTALGPGRQVTGRSADARPNRGEARITDRRHARVGHHHHRPAGCHVLGNDLGAF